MAETTPQPRDERVLRLLGLGNRARTVVIGVDQVRTGLQADRFKCLVVAADASPRAQEKVVRLARGKGVTIIPGPAAAAIGDRFGSPPVMVVGVVDGALAQGLADAATGDAQQEA